MLNAFDPSAFLAEESKLSQSVANFSMPDQVAASAPKTSEISQFSVLKEAPLAGIATIAGSIREKYKWGNDLCHFVDACCPAGVSSELWDNLTHEAWQTAVKWAEAATEQGWSSLDLFGCNPRPEAHRLDRNGLVAGIAALRIPATVMAIEPDRAVLQCGDSLKSSMSHYRGPAFGSVHLWHAYRIRAGP